jgi:transposase-like protein
MANAMLDARQEGDGYRRIEVITGQSRRRRWTGEEKARIMAESLEAGANISEVARRNGVARGLLTAWRRQFATGAHSKVPSFVRSGSRLRRAVAEQLVGRTVLCRRRRGRLRRHRRRASFSG